MRAWIHRGLRAKADLRVEELEGRIAPARVLTDGMSWQYNAADGDLVEAAFFGPGSATLANSTGADPGTPGDENLWYVDLVGTSSKSQLYIRDVTPGDGSDNLILHQVANMGGGSMGVIDLSASGFSQVRFADINMTCPLQAVNIHGAFYGGGVTTTSSVGAIAIDFFAELCGFSIGGNLGSFSVGGGTNEGYLDVAGHLGSARSTGGDMVATRVNIGSGCDRFEIYGSTWDNPLSGAAQFTFYSGVGSFYVSGDMVGTSWQSTNGNVGKFRVDGTVRNGLIADTTIALTNGRCGQVYVGGDFSADSLTFQGMRTGTVEIGGSVIDGADITAVNGGSCGRLTIGGDLLGDVPGTDRATITAANGSLGTLLIGGGTDYAEINCQACNQSLIGIAGAVNETDVSLARGAAGSLRIAGNVTNNTTIITMDQTLRSLRLGGNLDTGSVLMAQFGALHQTTVAGDVLNGSQIALIGTAGSSLSVGGGVDDASNVTLAFTAMRDLSIGGAVDQGSMVVTTGSDVSRIRIGGGIFDGSQVVTSLGTLRDLFIGGPIDSLGGAAPQVVIASAIGGNLTVAGHVFEGTITIASAGLTPGSRARILGDFTDSQFIVATASPLAGLEILGDVSGSTFNFAVSGGVDRVSIRGNVSTSALAVTGPCGPTIIRGSVDTVTWAVGGPHASFRTGGFANLFTYSATGPVGSFYVGGPASGSNLTFTGGCDLLMIRGPATGSSVAWGAPIERLLILGDANAITLTGTGGLDFFRVTGDATGLTAAIAGQTGMFLITGTLDAGTVNLDGMTDAFRVGGAVTGTGLTFTEHVGQMRLGSMSNSQITIANGFPAPGPASGGAGQIIVQGDVDATSTIVVFGPCGSALIGGDVLNSTLTLNNGLGRLSISGRMQDSNVSVLGGGVGMPPTAGTMIAIADGIWGGSALLVDGDCSRLHIGQGLNDTSTVDILGCASSVVIGGDMGQNTIVTIGAAAVNGWGYTYYTGTLQRMIVRGLILGNIDVYGTLHAIDSAGAAALPNGGSGAPFGGGFQPTNAFGAPIAGAQVDYVTLAPGGHVS